MWETQKVDHEMMKNEDNYGENKGQLQKYNSKNIRSVSLFDRELFASCKLFILKKTTLPKKKLCLGR